MSSMRRGMVAIIGGVTLVIALLIMQLTTPDVVGPLGVLAFFILIYISFTSGIYLGLITVVNLLAKVLPPGRWKLMTEGLRPMKAYYYSSTLALAPVILIGMQSVGEVRPLDIILLIIFEIVACFYISRRF